MAAGITEPATSRTATGALDLGAALFPPVVLLLIPFSGVAITNVNDLLYNPSLARAFVAAGAVVWIAGVLLIRWSPGGAPARLWVTLPWAVLLLDVIGAAVEPRVDRVALAAMADIAVIGAVILAAVTSSWASLRRVAAAAGVVLLVHGAWVHVAFTQSLSRELLVGAGSSPATVVSAPGADAPGNVYHILLDAYQGEAFSHSVGDAASRRFPGFTLYNRFNTNFPRTSSAEPAMIAGRFPRPGMSFEEWPAEALRDGFWTDLIADGVGVWLYPYGGWLCHPRAVQCSTSADLERDAASTVTRDTTIDLWALRLLPGSLRRALRTAPDGVGDPVEFSATAALRSLRAGSPRSGPAGVRLLPRQYFNLQQFDKLLADEASRPARGQYVYYHGLIPHHDYLLDASCAPVPEPKYDVDEYWAFVDCANLMIERLAARLRELGRFDDALIIVHADHGDPNFIVGPGRWMRGDSGRLLDARARQYQAVDRTYEDSAAYEALQNGDSSRWRSFAVEVFSSGLLLMKWPGAAAYAEDDRPVRLLDIGPTVLTHFGAAAGGYDGMPVGDVMRPRRRVFFAHSREFEGKLSRYELTTEGWQFQTDVPLQP